MGEFSGEDRMVVREFLVRLFDQMKAGTFGEDTVKTAIESVIADTTMGSKTKAFDYMRSVIKGRGT